MGGTAGYGGAIGETAAVGIAGIGRGTGAGRDVRAGGTSEMGETPEPRGLGDFDSGPPTPLQLLERGIPHQRGLTPQAGSVAHGEEGERGSVGGEDLLAPDIETAPPGVYLSSESNETSADGDILVERSETLSSDNSHPVPTMGAHCGAPT